MHPMKEGYTTLYIFLLSLTKAACTDWGVGGGEAEG